MKPISPPLLALLATRKFFAVDTYTITLVGSTSLRFCGGDADITVNGNLFPAGGTVGPYFDRKDNKAKVHQKIGLTVDSMTFDVIPGAYQIFGVPMLQAIRSGVFDGAEIEMDRIFMPTYGDTRRGPMPYFVGRVAEIDCGRSLATFIVNSHLELLDQNLPRNLYQPGCSNTLYDAACGVNSATYAVSGSITAVVAAWNFGTTLTGLPADYFTLGKLVMTSGVNNGLSASINGFGGGVMNLLAGFPTAPAVGDTFTAYPGCDKSFGGVNGCPKFTNTARYKGEPFIPQPTTAV